MSGGQMVGECLGRQEGFRCVTRENLLNAVNSYGDLATRITTQIAKGVGEYGEFSRLRYPYQLLMRRALLEYVQKGRLAYLGYSGHLLLARVRHFVRVRLIAPMEFRIARTCELLGYSEAQAREHIRRADEERARWTRMMYGVDIRDPSLYDLCLNIERLSVPGACALLRKTIEQEDFQPTPESAVQAEDYYFATQALAMLATDERTADLELGATLSDGQLRIVGPHLADSQIELVRSVAGKVLGISEVHYEVGYEPAFRYASG
jgi:hypothetical protein